MCVTTGVSFRVSSSRVSLELSFCCSQSFHFCALLYLFQNNFHLLLFLFCLCFLLFLSSSYCLSLHLFIGSPSVIYHSHSLYLHHPSALRVFITVLSGPTSFLECCDREWIVSPPPPPTGKVIALKILFLSNHLEHMPFKWLSMSEVR